MLAMAERTKKWQNAWLSLARCLLNGSPPMISVSILDLMCGRHAACAADMRS